MKNPGKWWRRVAVFVVALLLGLGLLILAVYWRLSRGAVSLDWFETRIEEALDVALSPLSVDLGGGSFRWSGLDNPVSIRFAEVRLYDGDRSELASLAGFSVDLSPSELLHRKVVPARMDVEALRIAVTRNQDGSLQVSMGDRQAASEGDTSSLLDSFLEPPQPDRPLGQLTKIGIHQTDLEVDDRKLGIAWAATDVDLEIERATTGLRARITFNPAIEQPLGHVTGEVTYLYSENGFDARIEFDALEVAALAPLHPTLDGLQALEAPLKGWIEADFAAGLAPISLRFDVSGDPLEVTGSVDFSAGPRSPSGTLTVARLDPWRFAAATEKLATLDNLRLSLAGTLDLVFVDGAFKSADADLNATPGQLTVPGVYDQPLELGPTTIKAALEERLESMRLSELRTTLGDSTLTVDLTADKVADGYQGRLHGTVNTLQVKRLSTYWPQNAAPAARTWVVDNITEGEVSDLELDLAVRLDPKSDSRRLQISGLDVSFDMHDLSVRALAPQPPISGIAGSASLTKKRLVFKLDKGQLGEIEIGDSTVTIGDFDTEQVDLAIQLECSTKVAEAIELISSEPLSLLDDAILAPGDVSGSARASVHLDLPLSGDTESQGTQVTVNATVQQFAWQKAPLDLELSDGDLEVTYARSALQVQGQVAANGVPATVDYRAGFSGKAKQHVRVQARLTEEDRDNLRIPNQTVVSGPVTASVSYAAETDGPTTVSAEIDLQESQVVVPLVEWRKPAGDAGKATVLATTRDSRGWEISTIDIAAGDLVGRGSVELDLEPTRLRSVTIERLQFRENRLGGSLSRDPEEGYTIRLRGQHLDGTGLPRRLGRASRSERPEASGSTRSLPMSLDFELDEIAAGGEVILTGLSGHVRTDATGLQSLEARASTQNDQQVAAHFGSVDQGHRGRLKTGDAGDLMKTLGLTSLFDGGELQITTERTTVGKPIEIELDIADMRIVESPVLERILRLGSLDGLLATMQGEGFAFKSVHGDLELESGVLQLVHGKAYGEGIAIILAGSIDTRADSWDMQGLVAPMGPIQRQIGKIPGLGKILMGRKKGGILGTVFEVTGPLDDPKVEVQPFSAFTPGILRELTRLTEVHAPQEPADRGHEP